MRYPSTLTPREGQVLDLMAEGLSNRQIADRLGIKTETVKKNVLHILQKLGVHNRTQAALAAVKMRPD